MTFLDVLLVRGVLFGRSAKPGEIWLDCPFCDDDRRRLGINIYRNLGHCFNGKCGFKSRHAIQTVLRKLNITTQISNLPATKGVEQKKDVTLPDDFAMLCNVGPQDDYLLRKARRYLLRRGITKSQLKQYCLGASLRGRFAYRVVIPVTHSQKLVGLVARDWTNLQVPKYLNSVGEKFVWNAGTARPDSPPLILAEGVFKALALEKALKTDAAALLGHSITENMVTQLRASKRDCLRLWSDPDKAGIVGTLRVAERLAYHGFRVEVLADVPAAQADEMEEDSVRNLARWTPLTSRVSQSYMRVAVER